MNSHVHSEYEDYQLATYLMIMTSYFITFVMLVACSGILNGDSLMPATPETISSPEGKFLLRKIPSEKSKNTKTIWLKTTLIVYQLDSVTQHYNELHRFDVKGQPSELFIDDSGSRIVTLDEWFGMGQGSNVVMIYDIEGKILRRWSLTDFYDKSKFAKLRRSTSSIYWRGDVNWSHDQKTLKISNPGSLIRNNDKSYSISYDNEFPSFVLNPFELKLLPKVRSVDGVSPK